MNDNPIIESPESKFEEAALNHTKEKPHWKILAAAVTIFLCVAILLIWSYMKTHPQVNPNKLVCVSLTDMVKTKQFEIGWSSARRYLGMPILVKTPSPDQILLDFSVDAGGFFINTNRSEISPSTMFTEFLGDQFTISSDYAVYWHYLYEKEDGSLDVDISDPPHYVRIILREEEHIVGYAVLQITMHPDYFRVYNFNTLSYQYFPKIDSEYQTITQEYVQEQMNAVIAAASQS